MYGRSQSIHTPSSWKSAFICFWNSSAKFLQVPTNRSMPYASISFLFLTPIDLSTLTSMGSPCMS